MPSLISGRPVPKDIYEVVSCWSSQMGFQEITDRLTVMYASWFKVISRRGTLIRFYNHDEDWCLIDLCSPRFSRLRRKRGNFPFTPDHQAMDEPRDNEDD